MGNHSSSLSSDYEFNSHYNTQSKICNAPLCWIISESPVQLRAQSFQPRSRNASATWLWASMPTALSKKCPHVLVWDMGRVEFWGWFYWMSCEGRRVGGPLVLEGGRNEQMVPFLHHVCCLPNILLGEAGKAWRCGNSSAKCLCHIKRTLEFQSNM